MTNIIEVEMNKLGFITSAVKSLSSNTFLPFEYSLDCPILDLSKLKRNKLRTGIIEMDTNERGWIQSAAESLSSYAC